MMIDLASALASSASGMKGQAQRLRHLSENIANADTPGYQRKITTFEERDGTLATGQVKLDRRPVERLFDPGHPLANADGYREGSNVQLVVELADAREAQQSYDANLKIFDQARQMSLSLLELVRR